MAHAPTAAVTAKGIRDGDRAALGALVARRGAAVLAYCDRVASPGRALEAAGEAFARFRREVVAAPEPRALDPEALLLGATRRAAAACAPRPAPVRGTLTRRRGAARGGGRGSRRAGSRRRAIARPARPLPRRGPPSPTGPPGSRPAPCRPPGPAPAPRRPPPVAATTGPAPRGRRRTSRSPPM